MNVAKISILTALMMLGGVASAQSIVQNSILLGDDNAWQDPTKSISNSVLIGNGQTDPAPGYGLDGSVIIGNNSDADSGSTNIGNDNRMSSGVPDTASSSTQVGRGNSIEGQMNTQIGTFNQIEGDMNITQGIWNQTKGQQNSNIGDNNYIEGDGNFVGGSSAAAVGNQMTIIGYDASGSADGCVAIGAGSNCNQTDEFSVGTDNYRRRVTHLRDGIGLSDAATVNQINQVANTFGAGARFIDGVLVLPDYSFLSGAHYSSVDVALYDLDGRVFQLEQNSGDVEGPAGPKGDKGDKGDPGKDGVGGAKISGGSNIEVVDNSDGTQSVSLTDNVKLSDNGSVKVGKTTVDSSGIKIAGGASMTTTGIDAGNRKVTGVANGTVAAGSRDAVNGGQLWDMDQKWNDQWMTIDNRMDNMDKRISGVCAMGAAQSQAVSASANNGATHKVMAGIGFCGGQTALSAGYSQDFTTPGGSIMSFSVGISSTGSDTSMGAGLSFGW